MAGLSPFTPHLPNQVHWLDHGNGLHFGKYATILSVTPLHLDGPLDGPCTVELWLQPALLDDSNTMLAFATPQNHLQFRMRQNNDALMLMRQWVGPDRRIIKKLIYTKGIFRQDTRVLISVTAGADGTTIYLDGIPSVTSQDFGLARRDLNGRIVIGNSPVENDSWSGVLRGIGIYNRELTADEVMRDYEQWNSSGQPGDLEAKKAVAIYPFAEHAGKVIHSQLSSGVDLEIPKYYLVLYPHFLQPFWQHWGWNWAFWKDGIINIAGFIPLGFFYCVYFSLHRPISRAILLTIIFGCAISFMIEATQYYLPTRDSDSMDFINNTLGTILGAFCVRPRFMQNVLRLFGIVSLEKNPWTARPATLQWRHRDVIDTASLHSIRAALCHTAPNRIGVASSRADRRRILWNLCRSIYRSAQRSKTSFPRSARLVLARCLRGRVLVSQNAEKKETRLSSLPPDNSDALAQSLDQLPDKDGPNKTLLVAACLIVVLVAITALVSAPNVWDAMEYHLPRATMWMSNHSVHFYPTPDYAQLIFGPWAEFAMMQTELLSGSDRFVNLVEFLSFLFSAIGVSLIAKMLGAGPRGQALAAIICITIPEGILEASGPMNTYVVSFWIMTTVLFLMLWNEDPSWLNTICVGLAAGLAIFTKGTAYVILPFLVLACWWMGSPGARSVS